jgi:hypothetical protein
MRKLFNAVKEKKNQAKAAIAAGLSGVGAQAMAAVDTTAVDTALNAAQTSGENVGGMVIGVVAGLAVVGVIIALVRKI